MRLTQIQRPAGQARRGSQSSSCPHGAGDGTTPTSITYRWDAPQYPVLEKKLDPPHDLLPSSSTVRENEPRRSDVLAEGCPHGSGPAGVN